MPAAGEPSARMTRPRIGLPASSTTTPRSMSGPAIGSATTTTAGGLVTLATGLEPMARAIPPSREAVATRANPEATTSLNLAAEIIPITPSASEETAAGTIPAAAPRAA